MWTEYDVTWDFITKLCASVPADKNLIEKWLVSRQPKVKPPSGKTITEINEEVVNSLANQEEEPSSLLIFQANCNSLVIRADTIRAHLKDCARVLSQLYVGKVQGEKSLAVRVKNGVYPDQSQYWIPVNRPEGGSVTKADGQMERPVHSMTPRGIPINALKCFEWIEPATLVFRLKVLGDCVKEADLYTIMEYGGVHGYGGERSAGEGKYVFRLTKIKEAENGRTKNNEVAKHSGPK